MHHIGGLCPNAKTSANLGAGFGSAGCLKSQRKLAVIHVRPGRKRTRPKKKAGPLGHSLDYSCSGRTDTVVIVEQDIARSPENGNLTGVGTCAIFTLLRITCRTWNEELVSSIFGMMSRYPTVTRTQSTSSYGHLVLLGCRASRIKLNFPRTTLDSVNQNLQIFQHLACHLPVFTLIEQCQELFRRRNIIPTYGSSVPVSLMGTT